MKILVKAFKEVEMKILVKILIVLVIIALILVPVMSCNGLGPIDWFTGSGAPAQGIGNDDNLYLDTTNGDVWLKENGAWSLVFNMMGLQGPVGPRGPAGLDGADGPAGLRGPRGFNGADGADGADGMGLRGPMGPAGFDGMDGMDGLDGLDGFDGAEGPTGPEGPAGPEGPQGPQGPEGGPEGPQGETGEKGDKGDTGDTGPQGPPGVCDCCPCELSPPASGTGTATAEVSSNPGGHPVLFNTITLSWETVESTVTFGGVPGVDTITGTLQDDDTFIAMGNGNYAGYATTFIFDGYFTPEGIFALLIIGSEGDLPGGLAIVYFIELLFIL